MFPSILSWYGFSVGSLPESSAAVIIATCLTLRVESKEGRIPPRFSKSRENRIWSFV